MSFSSLVHQRKGNAKVRPCDAQGVFGTYWVMVTDELPDDDLDTMLEDRQAPFRVDRLGSMVDGDAE